MSEVSKPPIDAPEVTPKDAATVYRDAFPMPDRADTITQLLDDGTAVPLSETDVAALQKLRDFADCKLEQQIMN